MMLSPDMNVELVVNNGRLLLAEEEHKITSHS